ncbi:MAG: SDR family oxidoreductase [Gemmatimonadales bacterium]|nr:SDR family oxidoreductase [Gemmatimonadales bacterium]
MSSRGEPAAGRRVVIVGATSAIAGEAARAYAESGARLFLLGRDPRRLAAVADDLRVHGARQVESAMLDVTDLARHEPLLEAAAAALGGLDVALVASGILPDQRLCETSVSATLDALDVNFSSVVALLTRLANRFETQQSGVIAVITSVAGDRGRQSNYVYGAAKGGLAVFLQGLRNRLHGSGVRVVTLKPGFVDTPMTAAIPKNPLFTSARRAGRAMHRAIETRGDVVYIPWFWRPIMAVVNNLPEALGKRLRL